MQAREPGPREFWREMETKWLALADSYQRAARTEALLWEICRFGEPQTDAATTATLHAPAHKAL
jgi:hypothetical protein